MNTNNDSVDEGRAIVEAIRIMRLNWYYVLVMAQHWNSRKYQSNLMIFGTILLYFLGEPCINFLTKVGKGKVLIQYISDIDTELSLLPESNKKRAENWTLCFDKSKESAVFWSFYDDF